MAETVKMTSIGRKTIESVDFEGLPEPLRETLSPSLTAVVDHKLLNDSPQRYNLETADEAVGLSETQELQLMEKFGARIKRLPFTIEGVPDREERNLSNDIWEGLDGETQKAIVDRTTRIVSRKNGHPTNALPDQSAYAKRLTHRYLQFKSRNTD